MKLSPRLHLLFPALLGVGLVVWMWASRPGTVRARGPAETDSSPAAARRGSYGSRGLRSSTAAAGSAAQPTPSPEPATSPGPLTAVSPSRISLNAAEEPVEGPEISPGITPGVLLENMRSVLHNYHNRYGGNPVGDNQEITRALNPGQTVFISSDDGLQLNGNGELIDNWGTPLFFHQISSTEMEIHSAGPDRQMWTADDLVIK